MKLLLFSDLHCDETAAQQLVDRSADVDVLVGAGDFATMRRGLERTLSILRQCERPVVMVAGNGESADELQAACADWPQAYVLHGQAVELLGTMFFGLGGAVPVTPFGSWSFDLSEEQARQLLRDCPEDCVLVSHSPPQGVVDRDGQGASLGSLAVRETVARCRPRLVVCGHIHASWGRTESLLDVPVVNAGPHGIAWEM